MNVRAEAELDAVRGALPSYEVRDELGRGAWGIVYDGTHQALGREVAIKQLPPAFAADAAVRSRFRTEARTIAQLAHPHIVAVYDFVETEQLCLLVMEKLDGGTLWSRFSESGLTWEASVAAVIAAAEGLQVAHLKGVLHRDVKPENLLFDRDGTVKVADFGIAKVLSGSQTMATTAGQVMGTPAYMAPEQAMGKALGATTDVYALGCVLYELLTGALPFEEMENPLAILHAHVYEEPVAISDVAGDVPSELAEVVMRSIAREPAQRFASAEDLAVALAGAASSSFDDGWLDRSGTRVVPSARVAERLSQPERRVAAPTVVGPGVIRPTMARQTSGSLVSARPQSLEPVDELVQGTPDADPGTGVTPPPPRSSPRMPPPPPPLLSSPLPPSPPPGMVAAPPTVAGPPPPARSKRAVLIGAGVVVALVAALLVVALVAGGSDGEKQAARTTTTRTVTTTEPPSTTEASTSLLPATGFAGIDSDTPLFDAVAETFDQWIPVQDPRPAPPATTGAVELEFNSGVQCTADPDIDLSSGYEVLCQVEVVSSPEVDGSVPSDPITVRMEATDAKGSDMRMVSPVLDYRKLDAALKASPATAAQIGGIPEGDIDLLCRRVNADAEFLTVVQGDETSDQLTGSCAYLLGSDVQRLFEVDVDIGGDVTFRPLNG